MMGGTAARPWSHRGAMTRLADVYRPSLALATDLYELTMA